MRTWLNFSPLSAQGFGSHLGAEVLEVDKGWQIWYNIVKEVCGSNTPVPLYDLDYQV